EHQGDLSLQVDAGVVVVAERRRGDAVADEDDRRREPAGAGEAERCPGVGGDAAEAVPLPHLDAGLDLEGLLVGLAEGGLQLQLAQARFEERGGAIDALRAEAAAFHVVGGDDLDVVLELFGEIRGRAEGQGEEDLDDHFIRLSFAPPWLHPSPISSSITTVTSTPRRWWRRRRVTSSISGRGTR